MACSGCGHRYNPASPRPRVNRVRLRTGQVVGRYHIKPVTPPATNPAPNDTPIVAAPATPVDKGSK